MVYTSAERQRTTAAYTQEISLQAAALDPRLDNLRRAVVLGCLVLNPATVRANPLASFRMAEAMDRFMVRLNHIFHWVFISNSA